jgi:hypothetical protein
MKKWSADFRLWILDFGLENYSCPESAKECIWGPGTKLLDCYARADCRQIKVIDLKGITIDFAVDFFTALIGNTLFALSSGTD